ncbi:MAG: hypothetical protein ACREQ5_15395, partial [Candidatus Dormibacteria bacterium]
MMESRLSRQLRVVSVSAVLLVALVGLITGCTSAGPGPSAGPGHPSLPPNCTHTITRADDLSPVLAGAA